MKFVFPYQTKFYIYKITNDINGKIYVGRTKKPDYRMREHISCSTNPERSLIAQKVHFAIKDIGVDHFTFEVFEELNNYKEACGREVFWIRYYRSDEEEFGYNDKSGPEFGTVMWSESDRQRMSLRVKGNKNPMYGKTHSEEARKQLSEQFSGEKNPFYGKTHSDETKKMIGVSSKGRVAGENNPHAKLTLEIVSKIREDWQTGEYTKAALGKKYNVTPVSIGNVISGKTWK